MRSNLVHRIKNLAAIQKATASRPNPQSKWGGLVRGPGKKQDAVPRIRIQSADLDSVKTGERLPENAGAGPTQKEQNK